MPSMESARDGKVYTWIMDALKINKIKSLKIRNLSHQRQQQEHMKKLGFNPIVNNIWMCQIGMNVRTVLITKLPYICVYIQLYIVSTHARAHINIYIYIFCVCV